MFAEAARRQRALIDGVRAFLSHPGQPEPASPGKEVWRLGSSRLLHFGSFSAAPLLVVPSLINRPHILDLDEERSLARHLASGHAVYLLDWGSPQGAEDDFDLAAYVMDRLEPAAGWIAETHGRPAKVFGYCMGGLLSIALATRRPEFVAALALAAVPWDFHAPDSRTMRLTAESAAKAAEWIIRERTVPGELILGLFYWNDPWRFEEKFVRFLSMDRGERDHFAQIERWANDCVSLASPAAHDCLIGWLQHNSLIRHGWQVGGEDVEPERLTCPIFIGAARHDGVVSPGSAQALIDRCRGARIVRPATGHIGMIVGAARREEFWNSLTDWLADYSG